jgi:glycerophosphoryl diester phosphodiesterase
VLPRSVRSVSRSATRLALLSATIVLSGCATQSFDLQGHRGARGLAPENTLAAFDKALDVGVSTLELDVGVTKDGIVVVLHDRALNPDIARDASNQWITSKALRVNALTYAELKTYDVGRLRPGSNYEKTFATQQAIDGERIPALRDLFRVVHARGADTVRLNIETKLSPLAPDETLEPEPFVRALIAEIEGARLQGRVTIQSFDWRTLLIAQRIAPHIATVYLTSQQGANDTVQIGKPGKSEWLGGYDVDDYAGSIPKLVKAAGGTAWSPHFRDLTEALVRAAHDEGVMVIPWTVNDETDMLRLVAWQVDGIITDYPDMLRTVMARRGMRVPPRYPARSPPGDN